jgi:hypothetical protein
MREILDYSRSKTVRNTEESVIPRVHYYVCRCTCICVYIWYDTVFGESLKLKLSIGQSMLHAGSKRSEITFTGSVKYN